MLVEIKVPPLAESIADATLLDWQKKSGEFVKRGDNLVDLETDKVTLEVAAQDDGILKEIVRQSGETVVAGDILAVIETDAAAPAKDDSAETLLPEVSTQSTQSTQFAQPAQSTQSAAAAPQPSPGPAVRKIAAEQGLNVSDIRGTGREGRVTKADVKSYLKEVKPDTPPAQTKKTAPVLVAEQNQPVASKLASERAERRVPMTRLRQRAAERLLSAQHDNAILTTFNEVNLHAVKQLRAKLQPQFEKKYGYRLGFMPFFVRAAINALREFPLINASIENQQIVYHDYYDIGIAVSAPRGLVVPVIRDADQLSFAGIEGAIRDLGDKARNSALTLEDLTGGTFTVTNGGTFGSMLSTPIINPPQSAILGMHAISDRPVAEHGQIVIRPVMYVALSYDHRIIDGREAVSFLVSIKKQLEDPALIFIGEI